MKSNALALLLLAAAATAAPAQAQVKPVKPAGVTTKPVEPLVPDPIDYRVDEDGAVEIALPPLSELNDKPENGVLVPGFRSVTYVPAADFFGNDKFSFNAKGLTYTVRISVDPVNDAPRFTPGSALGHASGTTGFVEVTEWASDFDVGAGEAAVQTWWFEAYPRDNAEAVVDLVKLDSMGNLVYRLTGNDGVAEWTIVMRDTAGGASQYGKLRIGVGQVADLSATISTLVERAPRKSTEGGVLPTVTYMLTVHNDGPHAAQAARVIDNLPGGAQATVWSCTGVDGGSCGAVDGRGAVDTVVDLPSGAAAVFTITYEQADSPTDTEQLAAVAPPGEVIDPDLSNNTTSMPN
jgi:uncharacterized repeat protein (TIGR01451 family)